MKKILIYSVNFLIVIALLSFLGCRKKDKATLSKAFVKYYGGLLEDKGVEVLQTSDGGYVIAGTTNQGTGPGDILIIKTDAEGNELWNKPLGVDSIYEECGSIALLADGGYIVVGTSAYKVNRKFDVTALEISKDSTCVYAARLSSTGDIVWSKKYNNPSQTYVRIGAFGKGVVVNSKGESFIGGMVDSSYVSGGNIKVNLDLYAFMIDGNGALLKVGASTVLPFSYGQNDQNDYTTSVILAVDKGLGDEYIMSSSTTLDGLNTPRIVKCRLNVSSISQNNAPSNKAWQEPTFYSGGQISKTMDNNYILTGTKGTPPLSSDIYTIKLNSTGLVKMSTMAYGDLSGFKDLGVSVIATTDGGYAILGVTNSVNYTDNAEKLDDVLLIKVDQNWVEQWHKDFGGKGNDIAVKVIQTADGGYLVCGTIAFGDDVSNSGASNSISLIKLNSEGELTNVE